MNATIDVSEAIFEIRDLLRLLAEPAIAERDQKRREELRRIVGSSKPQAQAVLFMNGLRAQADIHKETGIHKGQLSTLVKQLSESSLLVGDVKMPKLGIVVPPNFFEKTK